MRTLSDLFDLSIHLISYLFISLIFFHRERNGTRSSSRRIRRTLFSNLLQDDSTRDNAEAKIDFLSRGTQSQSVRAERRVISYSVQVHRRYQNTHTSLDVLLEKMLMITGTWMEKENYQMHGQVSQDSSY